MRLKRRVKVLERWREAAELAARAEQQTAHDRYAARPQLCAVCGTMGLPDEDMAMSVTFASARNFGRPAWVHKRCLAGSDYDRRKAEKKAKRAETQEAHGTPTEDTGQKT